MRNKQNNIAYIDAANLHRGIKSLGWEIDYPRFRVWLNEKHGVQVAYLFIGLIPAYKDLYTILQKAGFVLVFKETILDGNGTPKGNCDADLVLRATRDAFETVYDQAVIVSSDGDFASLVMFLKEKDKLRRVLSPSNKCSLLLKRTGVEITYLDHVKSLVSKMKKPPPRTEP